jgi:hypothetical protein
MLTGAGLVVGEVRSRRDDPPDYEAIIDRSECGVEVTELLHRSSLEQSIQAIRAREEGREPGPDAREVYFAWSRADLIEALQGLISRKDEAEPKGGPSAQHILVIVTDEFFLDRHTVEELLDGANFHAERITYVFLGLFYHPSPEPGELIEAVPCRIHTVLTDNGVQFTPRRQDIWDSQHIFDRVCDEHEIEHRLTKVNHPWTNGQVERMNRTIKDATVKRYHYDTHDQLRTHLQLFVDAYNHARRLKTLRGLTPYEFVCHIWTKEPDRFRVMLLKKRVRSSPFAFRYSHSRMRSASGEPEGLWIELRTDLSMFRSHPLMTDNALTSAECVLPNGLLQGRYDFEPQPFGSLFLQSHDFALGLATSCSIDMLVLVEHCPSSGRLG